MRTARPTRRSSVRATGAASVLLLTVIHVASACTARDSHPDTTVARDSAGIEIAESSASNWGDEEAWTIDPAPVLDLSSSGGGSQHEFYGVIDVARLPGDGSIVVAMRREIRFFSATGAFLGAFGREGQGPGEFSLLGDVAVLTADSLAALDIDLRRITVIGPDRELATVAGLDVNPRAFAALHDGFQVFAEPMSASYEGLPAGRNRMPAPVVAVSRVGRTEDTIAVLAGREVVIQYYDDGFGIGGALFGRDSYVAGRGARLVVGDAIAMEYRVMRVDGTVERIVRADYDVSLTPDQVSAEKAAQLGSDPSPRLVRYFDDVIFPERRPAYRSLEVDPTGAVWLQEDFGDGVDETTTGPKPWQVFSAEGVWLGRVLAPGRFTVHEVGVDYILGVFFDELDVEHVQLLRLRR